MKTEDVVIDLQKDNRITLNCTYYKDSTEDISNRDIKWQKQINGTFEDVAFFHLLEVQLLLLKKKWKFFTKTEQSSSAQIPPSLW